MNKDSKLYSKFTLLQINDALFPIGGYSHSYGLETYIQQDLIKDSTSAEAYIKSRIENSFLYNELLSSYLAFNYAKQGDFNKLIRLEEIVEASRIPYEIRSANIKLGTRFKKTIERIHLEEFSETYLKYIQKVKNPAHSIIYGVFCACHNIDCEEAMENYLYAQTSAMVITCVKSVPLSQIDGQKILLDCQKLFIDTLNKLYTLDEDMLCISCAAFDISSMQHENLYSRIYMS